MGQPNFNLHRRHLELGACLQLLPLLVVVAEQAQTNTGVQVESTVMSFSQSKFETGVLSTPRVELAPPPDLVALLELERLLPLPHLLVEHRNRGLL